MEKSKYLGVIPNKQGSNEYEIQNDSTINAHTELPLWDKYTTEDKKIRIYRYMIQKFGMYQIQIGKKIMAIEMDLL